MFVMVDIRGSSVGLLQGVLMAIGLSSVMGRLCDVCTHHSWISEGLWVFVLSHCIGEYLPGLGYSR
jgi:hypothetical protein